MRVVVTGGAGFIGSHFVDALLSQGHEVIVIDNFSSGTRLNIQAIQKMHPKLGRKLKVIRASVHASKTWEKLPSADFLVHCAAQSSVTESVRNPELDFRSNVLGILPMLSWVRKRKVRGLIFTGSAGAAYTEPLMIPSDEREPVNPSVPYGATKAFFEIYLSAFCRSMKEAGVWSSHSGEKTYFSWISLRLGNVYGPRQRHFSQAGLIPACVESLLRGQAPTLYGDGTKTRDYVHIRDVVRAFELAFQRLQKNAFDEIFHVGSGFETRDVEVFDGICSALKKFSEKSEYAARLKKFSEVNDPIFQKIRPGEIKRSALNCRKIEAFLGWKPEVSFEEGLVETVESYLL